VEPCTHPPGAHESRLTQTLHVMRDQRIRKVKLTRELTHAALTVCEHAHDAETVLIGESFEYSGVHEDSIIKPLFE